MANNTQKILLIFFITALSVTACHGGNMEVMCSGELEFEHLFRGQRDYFLREIVLPDSGFYERYDTDNKYAIFYPKQFAALKALDGRAPGVGYYPLSIVLEEVKSEDAKQHVIALCVSSQEMIHLPCLENVISVYDRNNRLRYPDSGWKGFDFAHFLNFIELKHLEIYGISVAKKSFKKIVKLTDLEYLGVHRLCDDDDIKYISELPKLKSLNLSGTDITGFGFEYLAKLDKLRTLDLRGTNLKNDALKHLVSCRNLETLLLSDTQTDDDDLKILSGIKTLKYITLHRTKVTDDGLKTLAKLKGLKYVSLYDTETSKAGHDLLNNNPGVDIILDRPQHLRGFLKERMLARLQMGDDSVLSRLIDRCEYGRRRYQSYKSENNLDGLITEAGGDKMPDLLVCTPVDYMSWLLIFTGYPSNERQIGKFYHNTIAKLEKELDVVEIAEAKQKARVFDFMRGKVSCDFKIEHQPGLPVYQYDFNWLGGKSADEFSHELGIQRLELLIEQRKDKLDKDRLELLKNKLKELKKEVKE